MKKLTFVLFFMGSLLCSLMHAQDVAYCNVNRSYVYDQPEGEGNRIGYVDKYEVVKVLERGDSVSPMDKIICSGPGDSQIEGYVPSSVLKTIQSDKITAAVLNGKTFKMVGDMDKEMENCGTITFKFTGNNFTASYRTLTKGMRRFGGFGSTDKGVLKGTLSNGILKMTGNSNPVLYDKGKRLLYMGGYLWEIK